MFFIILSIPSLIIKTVDMAYKKEYMAEYRKKKGMEEMPGKIGVVGRKKRPPGDEKKPLVISATDNEIEERGGKELVKSKLREAFKRLKKV